MFWVKEAEQLRHVSTLDRRQAQISVLEDRGLSAPKIVELITEYENEHGSGAEARAADYEDPDRDEQRIRSSLSTLEAELLETSVTQQVLVDGVSSVRPPARLGEEYVTDEYSVHVYAGDIGSGKTMTAQSHALRLMDTGTLDIVVLDVVDEWGPVAEANGMDIVDRVPDGGELDMDEYEEFLHEPDELLDALRDRGSETHTVLFIPEAHLMLDSRPEFLVDVFETVENVSVRLVMGEFSELPGFVDVDVYHFHATDEPSVEQKIKEIESDGESVLGGGLSELPKRFPRPTHTLDDEEAIYNPAYMVTAVPETGETSVRANLLSENEWSTLSD